MQARNPNVRVFPKVASYCNIQNTHAISFVLVLFFTATLALRTEIDAVEQSKTNPTSILKEVTETKAKEENTTPELKQSINPEAPLFYAKQAVNPEAPLLYAKQAVNPESLFFMQDSNESQGPKQAVNPESLFFYAKPAMNPTPSKQ
ncbi:uncharacterized protein LOC112341075 [Selaginella moellendorffii]|uniref:uncharacterized protein LOC112341075 n=1 Tax=Selaginella moellendorffii TaxID=88036 RepID=UPI000D1C6397|nr:uncharacterized protein LOC112341075 [Selaginella moellendorffii]|eukprot:XP_024516312.1 uncharacterized protein LOC112341075 [Selaginella moellendorffii]